MRAWTEAGFRIILPLIMATALPAGLAAQQQPPDTAAARRMLERQTGRTMSQAEVLERIRSSGMSRRELRARLQQLGYDPSIVDSYYDVIESGGELPRGNVSSPFLEALARAGLAGEDDAREAADIRRPGERPWDGELEPADTLETGELEVFGLRTFRRPGSQFEPVTAGPVDPSYRLGPGDELVLVLTGDVEAAYPLDVTRDGSIFIPDVGQVSVAGLTLGELRDVLYTRLGRVYSGVTRGADASTRFQLSLASLRTNQVFVRGEVLVPGAYQISSVGTLFTALYQAGGPTADGSFRQIEIHRGGRMLQVVDLYDFLIGGSVAGDVRLENNDHIFVPPAGPQVRAEGSVRRPAIYEVRSGEGIRSLLTYAGGLSADALVRRVQIDRILPPGEQRPGVYRTLIDVDLTRLAAGAPDVPLLDGDIVTVFGVSDERRNRLFVAGEVRNPGLYEWSPGATLWSVIERADGLGDRAYTARAHVYRLVPEDGSRQLIPVSLRRDAAGQPMADLPLLDNDSIVVLSRADLRTEQSVAIDGFVKFPETYDLAEGMTLKDLILAAGGFSEGAHMVEAEVSRRPDPRVRTDTTAIVMRVPLTAFQDASPLDGTPEWVPEQADLELRNGDQVFIRRAPGFEPTRSIAVVGEVMTPGTYVLSSRDERLSDIIARVGGLTPQAYPGSLHVIREGRVVAGDLVRGLAAPGSRNDIVLNHGDSVRVFAFDPTVTVLGEVEFEASVLYVPGEDLDYYIRQAGGYRDEADQGRTSVVYQNGERNAVRDGVFGRRTPPIEPGSRIFVPARAERPDTNWDQIMTRTAAILSAVATLGIAISQLR